MARIISEPVAGNIDHNNLADLTVGDDHTQYALLAGRATPQQFAFGTAASAATGYLTSTTHATKGKYFLNAAGTLTIDELNTRFGMGIASPLYPLDVQAPAVTSNFQSTTGTNYVLITYRNSSGALRIGRESSTGQQIVTGTSGYAGVIAVDGNYPLLLCTNDVIGLSLSGTGMVSLPGTTGALQLSRLTTTQRDALTPVNGVIIYNTTLEKFQGYENGTWTNLI